MIEIFKTDVENEEQAKTLLALLYVRIYPAEINFDLEDCDNILRIKGEDFCCLSVIQILADNGFDCRLLV